MISVVIPALNAEACLTRTLGALVPAAVDGIVRELIIADGGSADRTIELADDAGAVIVKTERGRGVQLIAGAERAKSPWLLFLHADTVLAPEWAIEAAQFMGAVDRGARGQAAAVFRFALDDHGVPPRVLERLVALRASLMKLPFGDQGLLISRRLYDEIGGFKPLAIMEDVDLVRRLGRRRLVLLHARALTSAARYRREGYLKRVLRNQTCLSLYFAGVPVEKIAKIYEGRAGRA